jgi:DNA-directed RNA polymerase subunit RPC12/RpoP
MSPRTLWKCGKCGTLCDEAGAEEAEHACPTCGQELNVNVRTLSDPDETELAELREEELAFDRIADDVDS